MKYYYNVIVNQLLLKDDYQADYTNALTLYSRALDILATFYYKKIPCIVSYDKDTNETYCYLNGTRVPVLIYDDTKESYPEYINKVIGEKTTKKIKDQRNRAQKNSSSRPNSLRK